MPKRDRQAERREATRREIVEAAWEIARQEGLATVTLREVAARIGMQPPSLYTHFASKSAIYDAMFGEAWTDYLEIAEGLEGSLPTSPRKALLAMLQSFVDFAMTDHARFQLMNQRMLADFEPSVESYAPSVRVMELFRQRLIDIGVRADADRDLCVAIVGGLIDAQFANDLGGDRWIRQLPRAVDMFADEIGLPGPRLRRTR
ncbi:MAG: TetR/AcrR family transcriptional regulator [Actinomycetota bacterium]|nr:TetR/AcrR family transcriptional regulator [Actinomycetota bacterium]